MKKQIVTTAAAMAVTALMAFQPMTAFAATGSCSSGTYNTGCSIQVCQNSGSQKGTLCGQNGRVCGQNSAACSTRNSVSESLLNGNKKNLSGKNCGNPQMISYVIGKSGCRR